MHFRKQVKYRKGMEFIRVHWSKITKNCILLLFKTCFPNYIFNVSYFMRPNFSAKMTHKLKIT